MKCRHCASRLQQTLVDLGSAPPSNAYLSEDMLNCPETWLPLRVLVCNSCWLVQTADVVAAERLFTSDYAYLSGMSSSWLAHCERYARRMIDTLALGPDSMVVELASNDGSLLQFFVADGIPCFGVEPTASTAVIARARGIDIVGEFFGRTLAERLVLQGRQADLLVANNVLAHVPAIDDFVEGVRVLLKPAGVATFEFPHLLNLLEQTQFDTIYHEHFSYLSLTTVERILEDNGLVVFEVQELPVHGGSLRVHVQRRDTGARPRTESVDWMLLRERSAGLCSAAGYAGFMARVEKVKDELLAFLLRAKRDGAVVVAYGAAAKGNTLLNYAGVRSDLLRYVVDRNPVKQGRYLPGSRIPIVAESRLQQDRPDYILLLPWNLRDELQQQLRYARDWGAKFVTGVPELAVF